MADLTKKRVQELIDLMDESGDFKATDAHTIVYTRGDKKYTRKIEDDAGVANAIVTAKNEAYEYEFNNAYEPAEEASNKTDGKKGLKKDDDNRS